MIYGPFHAIKPIYFLGENTEEISVCCAPLATSMYVFRNKFVLYPKLSLDYNYINSCI